MMYVLYVCMYVFYYLFFCTGFTSSMVKKASGEYSVHLPRLNKAKVNGVWCDRWETTYSCKSGASAASHAKLHAQLTAQSGVTRLTGQIRLRERGEWMKWRIWRERRVREGAKLTWSWLFLCQLNSLACSVPSEASELWCWPGHPSSMVCIVGKDSGLSPYHSLLSTHTLSRQKPNLLLTNPYSLEWSNLLGYYCTSPRIFFLSPSHQQTSCKLAQGNGAILLQLGKLFNDLQYVLLLSISCYNQGFRLARNFLFLVFFPSPVNWPKSMWELEWFEVNPGYFVSVAQCYMARLLTIHTKWEYSTCKLF